MKKTSITLPTSKQLHLGDTVISPKDAIKTNKQTKLNQSSSLHACLWICRLDKQIKDNANLLSTYVLLHILSLQIFTILQLIS